MVEKEKELADFHGWFFPEDPDSVCPVNIVPDFIRAEEKNRFKNSGSFAGTVFASSVWFDDATFSGRVSFYGATFSHMATFAGATFSGMALFDDATFSAGATFTDAAFNGTASFRGATFSDQTTFLDARFSGMAWFIGATFSRTVRFNGAMFSGDASFKGATFSDRALFDGATFSNIAWFDDTTFSGETSFFDATFSNRTFFRGAVCNPGVVATFDDQTRRRFFFVGRPHPFRHRKDGENAYRFAKQSAQQVGDYTAAGSYHYAEQCAIEDRWRNQSGMRPWRAAFWSWFGRLVFGRVIFGYGERPFHPLLCGFGVIAIWTALYVGLAAIAPGNLPDVAFEAHQPSWGEAAHFSIVTFTTLGYGDFQPKSQLPYRLLADAEAMLGATLMAVFVVCLTRKYMR
ncbi:MAG: pentapeptide repeat-containing protein [Phycisphaerae bacterium]|nr:pentapeptide repeat-containing protein [Phycisphaerae bacterium]